MGGNALKNTYTERKNTDEFLRIGSEIQHKILNDLKLDSKILKCYNNKETHGDLDLLIKLPLNNNIDFKKYIQNSFKPNEMFCNGGVCSFDNQNFQIDFIPIIEDKWEIAQTYGFYDPLGNIMGKTFHKFGLSYGWGGLFYKFRNFNGRNSRNILISTDARRIFEFGGYDYDRYLQGFETLEEILKFAINTKYFDTEIFQMDNLKSIDKKRNRKRGSYHVFLKYLKDNDINIRYDFNSDKTHYLAIVKNYFPDANLMEKLSEIQRIDSLNKIISQKFNGDMIMSWLPNLKGKELGQAISKFKESFDDDEDYREFILNGNFTAIKERFMDTYNDKFE
ncbi:MAG: hypothetical protein PF487_14730 [Bacteroidales bacterium]|jgi:hypothetical protein|nr:hypothetical protein [Bacteroidales bacterium]